LEGTDLKKYRRLEISVKLQLIKEGTDIYERATANVIRRHDNYAGRGWDNVLKVVGYQYN
jgi:hypothetical protein